MSRREHISYINSDADFSNDLLAWKKGTQVSSIEMEKFKQITANAMIPEDEDQCCIQFIEERLKSAHSKTYQKQSKEPSCIKEVKVMKLSRERKKLLKKQSEKEKKIEAAFRHSQEGFKQ